MYQIWNYISNLCDTNVAKDIYLSYLLILLRNNNNNNNNIIIIIIIDIIIIINYSIK